MKPSGRFVFSLCHPCFNNTGSVLGAEEAMLDGELVETRFVKVTTYLSGRPQKGVAMRGQPAAHYYFDRPLHALFYAAFRVGLVLDGLEEPSFDHPRDGSTPGSSALSWTYSREIPPVLVARFRIPE